MKTVFHANIDGQEVVLGFGEAFGLIDPVATSIKIAPLLTALPEQQALAAMNGQINARRGEAGQAWSLAERARLQQDASTMVRENARYQSKLAELDDLGRQLTPLVAAFSVASAAIWNENAVYFHPPQGETLIDDAQGKQFADKHASRGPGQALLMTGEYVTDLRGTDFYLAGPPWAHKVIDTLGEELPRGALTPDILTEEQRSQIAAEAETARVSALSPADRQAEADAKAQTILAQAAQMRSELEIQGDPAALSKSQAWYKAQAASVA
jgi:hypothetical protein